MKATEIKSELQFLKNGLTAEEKKVIRLLQNKETVRINNRKIFVTSGNKAVRVSVPPFFNLVNKGLVHQSNSPYNYVLSKTGKLMEF